MRKKGKSYNTYLVELKKDYENEFKDFKWDIKGILGEDGYIYPIPKIPQVISGLFEMKGLVGVRKVVDEKYKCDYIEGGSREYPDVVLTEGLFGKNKIAIDIKTARRQTETRCSRMSLGSCAGYFLYPDEKRAGCMIPYGHFAGHLVIGFIYDWRPDDENMKIVSNIEVVIQPKWKIASRSTATGDTAAIGAITDIRNLKNGQGDFGSETAFETYWRSKGRSYKR